MKALRAAIDFTGASDAYTIRTDLSRPALHVVTRVGLHTDEVLADLAESAVEVGVAAIVGHAHPIPADVARLALRVHLAPACSLTSAIDADLACGALPVRLALIADLALPV